MKYVAVKMLTANTSYNIFHKFVHETDILECIKENSPKHAGPTHCLQMLGMFPEKSEHGDHICIVTEMLGGSLVDLRHSLNMRNALPIALVKRIVKQKLQALDFLHRTCGIVHTGRWFTPQCCHFQLTQSQI
jgi:serine/threonine-protein kinase SRPK3